MYNRLEAGSGSKPILEMGSIMETKKIKNRTELLVYILAVLGLVVIANYLGTRWFKRIDLTEAKEYSVSNATKKILKNLDDIITIKVFFSKNLPPHLNRTVTNVKDLLSEYSAYAGSNLRISWEDPAENEEAKQMARSMGIPEVQMQTFEKDKQQVMNGYLGIAVLYEDKKEALPVVQNLQNLEYDLTMAIMKVSRSSVPKVGILKVDTMPTLPPQMRGQMSNPESTEEKFSQVYESLRNNYEVSTVDLSSGSAIDSSIKTLIVPGLGNMNERKIFEIDQFFMNGGNVIVLADAVTVNFQYGINAVPQESKLLDLLEHYGVRVEKNMVLDASCGQVTIPQKFGPFQMNVAVPYPYFIRIGQEGFNKDNPAVAPLSEIILPWASSLTLLVDQADSSAGTSQNVKATVLAQSSQKSWLASGHFNLDPQQKWAAPQGGEQQNLIAHLNGNFQSYFAGKQVPPVKEPETEDALSKISLQSDPSDANRQITPANTDGHLVVVGDADFVAGQNATQPNVAMLLNVVDWLSLDNNLIAIRTRALKDRTIETDLLKDGSSKPNLIRLVNILAMPLLVIIIGLVIFMKRREPVAVAVVPQEKTEDKNK